MNDQIILTIAQAILANTKALQGLVDALPKETREAVALEVAKATEEKPKKAAKHTPVEAPVATPAPVVVEQAAPAPVPTPAPVEPVLQTVSVAMPEAPFPTVSAAPASTLTAPVAVQAAPAAAAPATASPSNLPFSDKPSMIKWIMEKYKNLGPRGSEIQNVLNSIGHANINDVPAEKYAALVAGVEALG